MYVCVVCAQAYYILDELLISGELQESSKKTVLRVVAAQDQMMEEGKDAAATKKATVF